MGGKSSSSNQTTTSNVSGQNAIQGNNLGTALSGINNSTITVTATDYGAIEKSHQLGELSINQMGELSSQALDQMGGLSKEAIKTVSLNSQENLAMLAGLAGNQAAQNTQNLEAMMDLAKFKQDNGGTEQSAIMSKNIAIGAATAVAVAYLVTR